MIFFNRVFMLFLLVSISVEWVNAQTVSTCGATAPELPNQTINVGQDGTLPLPPLSVESNLPDLEYAIQLVGLPASDTLGDQIVGFTKNNTFNLNDFGLQTNDYFIVTPIAYDLSQSQQLVDAIFNGTFLFSPCCNFIGTFLPNTCENLEAAGIYQGSDVQGLEDILKVIFTFVGDTTLTASVLGLASWLDGFNEIAGSLPASCGGNQVPICYALSTPRRIDFNIKVLLEGAYLNTGEMSTTLNTGRHLLPGQTPSGNLATPTPAGQPYHRMPWNYTGMEGANWTDANYSPDVVDWLLVSFRVDIEKNTEIGRRAALLLKDGTVEILDDFELPSNAPNAMYIIIEHRNHIGAMTPQAIMIVNNTLTYDFTLADSYNGGGTGTGQKQLPSGKWVMLAGDADQSDFPSYDIVGSDKISWEDNNGAFDYYTAPDFDMNGDVNGADKVFWFDNNGVSSRVPK